MLKILFFQFHLGIIYFSPWNSWTMHVLYIFFHQNHLSQQFEFGDYLLIMIFQRLIIFVVILNVAIPWGGGITPSGRATKIIRKFMYIMFISMYNTSTKYYTNTSIISKNSTLYNYNILYRVHYKYRCIGTSYRVHVHSWV